MSKILIVDDNREILKILYEFFTIEKHEVVTADSGKKGLKLAKRLKPDLMLLDIMMPDMEKQRC